MKNNPPAQRLEFFDGIRAIAALMVLNEHFLKIFMPSAFMDSAQWPVSNIGIQWLSFPPFNLLHNGAPAVTIFFVMSGWVLSRYITAQQKVNWWGEIAKRYLRLTLPALASLLLIFFVMQTGDFGAGVILKATGSQEIALQDYAMGFIDIIEQGLYGAIIMEDHRLNPPLWTLAPEFYGAAILFAIVWLWSALARYDFVSPRGLTIAIIFFAAVMMYASVTSILFGMFIGMVLHNLTSIKAIHLVLVKNRRLWMLPALILGVLLFSYMVRGSFQNPYTKISFWGLNPILEYAYNAVGAGLILLVVYYSQPIQKILEKAPLLWLGKLSFSIYLTHYLVLMTIGIWVKSFDSSMSSTTSIFLTGIVSFVAVITVAMIFERVIDRPSIRVSRMIKGIISRGFKKPKSTNLQSAQL